MKTEFSQQLLTYPSLDFRKHLEIEGNNRILFSGKFGIGKSFFLSHFFGEETQRARMGKMPYEAFHIYPVNYSIASNEDVFRYIKYDLITTLLQKNIQLEEADLRFLDTLPEYLKDNPMKVLATLLYMIPKIGKDLYGIYEKLEPLREDFLKYHRQHKKTEGDHFIEFLKKVEYKEGSVFENDIITRILCNVLERRKKENNRENILVIDDMDRIDPEHVFRLLNVFAAHLNDPNNLSNKLGFHKVIIVCDIENLRHIFKARYGTETDFNGYIDKFYSYDIYHFDNKAVLTEISYEAFKNVELKTTNEQAAHHYRSDFFSHHSLALDLLEMLIYNGFVSLRNLVARLSSKIELDVSRVLKFDDMTTVFQRDVVLLVHFRILKEIVGGYDILKEFFSKLPPRRYSLKDINKNANALLFFVHFEQTFRVTGPVMIRFNDKELTMKCEGAVKDSLKNMVVLPPNGATLQSNQYKYTLYEFKLLLLDFIDLMKRIDN